MTMIRTETAADIAARHPEYHAMLVDEQGALEKEWTPESGQMNPFLHLSLHLAIHEQVSIDQPPGIRAAFEGLRARLGQVALRLRDDVVSEFNQREANQKSAPAVEHGLFLVPKVIE